MAVDRLAPFLDDILLGFALLVAIAVLVPDVLLWAILGFALWMVFKVWLFRAHLRRPAIGTEAMEGRVATAITDMTPRGQVDLDGEIWDAEAPEPVRKGERVQVAQVVGLTLRVAPLGTTGPVWEPPGSFLLALAKRLRRG